MIPRRTLWTIGYELADFLQARDLAPDPEELRRRKMAGFLLALSRVGAVV